MEQRCAGVLALGNSSHYGRAATDCALLLLCIGYRLLSQTKRSLCIQYDLTIALLAALSVFGHFGRPL